MSAIRRILVIVMVGLVAVVIAALWAVDQVTPADAPVPAGLERWLSPARDAARSQAGLAGLVPLRFVSARCSADGTYAALAFEPVIGPGRAYALIGMPSASQPPGPQFPTTIIGESSDAFAADATLQANLSSSCDEVLSP